MAENRILLIDDQPLVLSAIAHYLSQHGYEIHTAVNGREGLAKAEEVQPNLVITDVVMPVMDGWALVRALRSNPLFALLPVIILTDQDSPESRIQGFRIGADDFVSKTTLVEELEVRIARALERGAATAQAISRGGGGPSAARTPPPAKPHQPSAGLDLPPLAQAMGMPTSLAPDPPVPSLASPPAATPAATPESGMPGIQGSLDDIGLASVMTLLSTGEQSGVLTLADKAAHRKARMLIRAGRLLKINLEDGRDLPPAQAVAYLMRWKGATFSFSRQDVTARDEVKLSTEHVLMEASQYLDEGSL